MECDNKHCSAIKCGTSIVKSIAQIVLIYFLCVASCSYEKSNDKYIEWSNLYINYLHKINPESNAPVATPANGPSKYSVKVESPYSSWQQHPSR